MYVGNTDKETVYGANASFSVLAGFEEFELPLLLWSNDHTHMRFNYNVNVDGSFQIHENVTCYGDLEGTRLLAQWSQDIGLRVTPGYDRWQCFSLIDFIQNPSRCATFKAKIAVSDDLSIGNVQFGDDTLCSSSPVQKQVVNCTFDNEDCGIRNDGCGLVEWKINVKGNPAYRSKHSAGCDRSMSGIPLLRKQINSTCSYLVEIPRLQPSGFTLIKHAQSADVAFRTSSRRRRTAGYALFLDPGGVGNVATGVLDLPPVSHSSDNKFMTFYHDMVAPGLHDLMVTAVCTSDPGNSLIPLGPGGLHYHRQNFDGSGSSGTICLTIHDYVLEENCSEFAIQMHGAAVDTVLEIDDIFFHSLSCGKPRILIVTVLNGRVISVVVYRCT